jgi:D-sedoheptulose 7-phosphate isomerase
MMKNAAQLVEQMVDESLRVKSRFFEENRDRIVETAAKLAQVLKSGHKVLFFGNGGSAADAQHLAAELVGRFGPDRSALPGISLSTDTSILTALSNDYGYDKVFSRQIEALCQTGDAVFASDRSSRPDRRRCYRNLDKRQFSKCPGSSGCRTCARFVHDRIYRRVRGKNERAD